MLWLHCPKGMGKGSEREAPPETRNRERRAAATPQRRDGNGRQPSLTRPRIKPDRNAGRVFPCPAGGRADPRDIPLPGAEHPGPPEAAAGERWEDPGVRG